MEWQMVGFVRERNMAAAISLRQVKTRDRITITG